MTYKKQMLIFAALLVAVIFVFEVTDWDLAFQDRCYNFQAHKWIVNRKNPLPRAFFYDGPKILTGAIAVASFAAFALSWKKPALRRWRKAGLLMTLSIICVPVTIAAAKQVTNVFTPSQTLRYGGRQPYVKLLQHYPSDFKLTKRGKGYPAGHATTGLALMMAYFCFRRRRNRLIALGVTLAWGLTLGLYQTLNGQHFLSHTFVSAIAGWMIILTLHHYVGRLTFLNPAEDRRDG